MVRIEILVVAVGWFALGYANYRWPAKMYRFTHWPLSPRSDVGDNVRRTYKRRGYVAAAIGIPFLFWGLIA